MKTLKTFSDGGRMVEVLGIVLSVSRSGSVNSMSDWCRAEELVRSGHLTRETWKGHGMYGHDTYRLI